MHNIRPVSTRIAPLLETCLFEFCPFPLCFLGTVAICGTLIAWTCYCTTRHPPIPGDMGEVVLASASIPILVQPVQTDGEFYADGRTRAQLFFERRFFPTFQKMKAAQRLHPDLSLHVIVNGKPGLERTNVNDCLKEIALRTLHMFLDANGIGDLYQIEYVLRLNHSGNYSLSWIPTEIPVTSSGEFDLTMMRKLYEADRRFDQSTAKWLDTIPDLDLNRH